MTDGEAIEAIMNAEDKSEQTSFNGNIMTSLEMSSASVGKKVTFYYGVDGGMKSFLVSDI